MTEYRPDVDYDLFARQALISGNRVPMLWNGVLDILEILHHQADVDIGGPGTGLLGIPVTESKEQAAKLPYAVRYLKCAPDRKDLCDEQKYNGRCWVHRPDVTPPVKQGWGPGSGGSHHPGFRTHQLLGRVLAFTILTALQEGLTQWKDSPDYALPDSAWHVSAHYQNIRNKLAKLTTTPCFNDTTIPTPRLCTTPMKVCYLQVYTILSWHSHGRTCSHTAAPILTLSLRFYYREYPSTHPEPIRNILVFEAL